MKKFFLYIAVLVAMTSCGVETTTSDEWVDLFNGKDYTGWLANESPESFSIDDTLIICSGARSHVFYQTETPIKNFELVAEVKSAELANSGIFFHTVFQDSGFLTSGYEVQINNSYPDSLETRKTGSLYNLADVTETNVLDNEWFTMRIKVVDTHVDVFVNDKQVVNYDGITPGEGTIALQAHDANSKVWFRSIKLKRLP